MSLGPAGPGAGRRSDGIESLAVGTAVFLSGGVLLGVEIAASRLLAPFFGNSLFVWGALIGVVLTGLAVGYWLGGALADRVHAPALLFGAIALGGVFVALVPRVDEDVLGAITDWDPGPRLAPLVAATILFGPLSVVLAAVTPAAIRVRARSVERLGRTAGRLFAVSTAGSIAGTFATAFFLVPELGVSELFGVGAATLFAAAAIVAALDRRVVAVAAATSLAVAAGLLTASESARGAQSFDTAAAENWTPAYRVDPYAPQAARPSDAEILYADDTRYHRLFVTEEDGARILRFDALAQGGMELDDEYASRFPYADYLNLGLAYRPEARKLLMLGLGAGLAPKRMLRDFPELEVDVAELDPAVVDVAERFFGLPDDEPRLDVEVGDGRSFLSGTDERYDVIVVDAFFAEALPFHLFTHEFVELARDRLEPGGAVVVNLIGSLAGERSRLVRSVYRTYRTVFPTVAVHPVYAGSDDPEARRNVILVATEGAAPPRDFLADRWAELRDRYPTAPDLADAIADRLEAGLETADVPTLTDDYAPTDALLELE